MNYKRYLPILALVTILFLAALACQVSTASPPTLGVDKDALVKEAVATVEAELASTINQDPDISTTQTVPISADLQSTLVEIYKRVNPGVVHIYVSNDDLPVPLGEGSGFIYDEQGHIVTNNHVVVDGTQFEVVFADGSRQPAVLVGTDVDSDLAVIKVDAIAENYTPISLSDSSLLNVGQFAVAIGNPFGEAGSMSVGIISGLGRTLDSQRAVEGGGRYSLPQVIQTDAAINPGNSGGPLLNLNGEVIGVNSAILTRSGTNSGVGFSIPVNAVKRVVPAIISDGGYVYPYLGISMAGELDLASQQELGLPSTNGVYVTNVVPNTPADAAGLIGQLGAGGDFITAIDGNSIKDSSDLISYLVFETTVGQEIQLTVFRDGVETTIPLTLGARP